MEWTILFIVVGLVASIGAYILAVNAFFRTLLLLHDFYVIQLLKEKEEEVISESDEKRRNRQVD